MINALWLIPAVIFGAIIGITVVALCDAAKHGDE